MKRRFTGLIGIMALILFQLLIVRAFAHKVSIFAYSENGRVFSESYFPDGTKVQEGKIEVFDSNGVKLLEGVTDDEGIFDFSIPKKDELKIALTASLGHKGFFILRADELELDNSKESVRTANNNLPDLQQVKRVKKRPKRRRPVPKEKNSVAIIAGLGFIMSLTSLVLHFTKKDHQVS